MEQERGMTKSLSLRDALKVKARSKPNSVHHAAETGDIKALEHFIKEGIVKGNPESESYVNVSAVVGPQVAFHTPTSEGFF